MKKYLSILKKTQLFAGIDTEQIDSMLTCLGARLCRYKKGEYVLSRGEQVRDVLVLVEGKLHIQEDDYWGNRSILDVLSVGDVFGEAYAAPDSGPLQSDVSAVEDSAVIFLDVKRMITTCSSACPFHSLVVHNMFFEISSKNRMLVKKLAHMSRRTTREKLISYLSEESKRQNNSSFSIPFNRRQLADYLAVDRSAMSNELCKLRDDGLLLFEKNNFTLLGDSRSE